MSSIISATASAEPWSGSRSSAAVRRAPASSWRPRRNSPAAQARATCGSSRGERGRLEQHRMAVGEAADRGQRPARARGAARPAPAAASTVAGGGAPRRTSARRSPAPAARLPRPPRGGRLPQRRRPRGPSARRGGRGVAADAPRCGERRRRSARGRRAASRRRSPRRRPGGRAGDGSGSAAGRRSSGAGRAGGARRSPPSRPPRAAAPRPPPARARTDRRPRPHPRASGAPCSESRPSSSVRAAATVDGTSDSRQRRSPAAASPCPATRASCSR